MENCYMLYIIINSVVICILRKAYGCEIDLVKTTTCTACVGQPMTLQCPEGHIVTGSIHAGFQRTDSDSCEHSAGDCLSLPFSLISSIAVCLGRLQSCGPITLGAWDGPTGDHCEIALWYPKYLVAENVTCVPENTTPNVENSTSTPQSNSTPTITTQPLTTSPTFSGTATTRTLDSENPPIFTTTTGLIIILAMSLLIILVLAALVVFIIARIRHHRSGRMDFNSMKSGSMSSGISDFEDTRTQYSGGSRYSYYGDNDIEPDVKTLGGGEC